MLGVIVPCTTRLPAIGGDWCNVFLAGHDHCWLKGRLESPGVWEIDTRRDGIPSHVEVERELITHWMDELPSPFDLRAATSERPAYALPAASPRSR